MNERRRRLLLGAAAAGASRFAWAQAGARYRLGWLGTYDASKEPYSLAFVQRLDELGFVQKRNLTIEYRHGDGKLERLPAAAAALQGLQCDVFFGSGPEANLAALKQFTRDRPIVFVAVDFDPVSTGYVSSLAQPGGRITGVTALQGELPGKRLELLKDVLPAVHRIAVLTNEQTVGQLQVTQATAKRIGAALHVLDLKRPPFDYDAAFAEAVRARCDAITVLGSALWVPARRRLCELSLKSKLPGIFHNALWTETGGLLSYGFDFPELWRRAAEFAARVLRGANVGELPMEQPTRYELAVNLKTARALGIAIPKTFLFRADRVFE